MPEPLRRPFFQKGSIGKKIFLDVTFRSHDNDYQYDINYHLMVCFINK
jgi:hypothetical protein